MKNKLWFWIVENAPTLLPFLKKKTENGAAKTAAEKAVAGIALAKSIKESTTVFEALARRYFKSRDLTISTAILSVADDYLHPDRAAGLYAQMKINNPTIAQVYGQLIKPFTKLKEMGAITNADYEGFKRKIDGMFVLKFKEEITNHLKIDFGDAVNNMIVRNDSRRITSVNYGRLNALVRNKRPNMKIAIVNEVVKQINEYVVADARNAAISALRGQSTQVNMTNIVSRLNSNTSPSRFAYALDIYNDLYANRLISQQDLNRLLLEYPSYIRKGYTKAIEQYNNRSVNIQRPNM